MMSDQEEIVCEPSLTPDAYKLSGRCWHMRHVGPYQGRLCEAYRACRGYTRSSRVSHADLVTVVEAFEADWSGDHDRQRRALDALLEMRGRVGVLAQAPKPTAPRPEDSPVRTVVAPATLTLQVQDAPELRDHPDDLVVFDTETTGRSRDARIVDLAAVRVRPGRPPLDRFEELVQPGIPIPYDVTAVHGITDAMVADARGTRDVLTDFFAFVRGTTLVAHNASYDLARLRFEAPRVGLTLPDVEVLDSLTIARKVWPDLPSHALQELRKHFKLQDRGAHCAMPDVLMLLDVLRVARRDLGTRSLRDAHGPALRLRETSKARRSA